MTEIIIADDHPIVRSGLRQIIEETSDISIACEVSNGMDLLKELKKRRYDVLILDIKLPDLTGLELMKRIRELYPRFPILILSMYPEEQYAVRTIRMGADGYLTKERFPEELVTAIRKVAEGGKYISSSVAEKLALQLDSYREKLPHEHLTPREYEIMCLIASGMETKNIASSLSISKKTVAIHRAGILEKLNLTNNVEIARYAIINDLVSL